MLKSLHLYTSFLVILLLLSSINNLIAQNTQQENQDSQDSENEAPVQVDVQPAAADEEIRERLSGILNATGWFSDTEVEVNDGVVFLRGNAETEDYKTWAGNLARNTQDVAAVVNQIKVVEPDIWNYGPAFAGLQELWQNLLRALPFLVFGIVLLILFWGISLLTAKMTRRYLGKRNMNTLLQDIGARGAAVVVFLLGLYIIFHVANLTNVAFTVLGGTGLLGIVLGIAFRDITENFLASVFLSVQNPFRTGDFVEISDKAGVIQRMTIRATVLMTLDGNHLQIPNATVYKSSITNYTSNPNQRTKFIIGIGYDDSISNAQEIGSKILAEHPAVLKEPEPWVLAEELAASSVNIQFYFWVDGSKHNILKVKSSVIRLVKAAYQKAGISLPDEGREVIFPEGVQVQMEESKPSGEKVPGKKAGKASNKEALTSGSEGEFQNNADEIQKQARQSRIPEEGGDLLKSSAEEKSPSNE